MEIEERMKMKTLSLKVESDDERRFMDIHEALDSTTKGQTFQVLLDRFEQPMRVSDRNNELTATIEKLKTTLEQETARADAAETALTDAKVRTTELEGLSGKSAEEHNRLQAVCEELQQKCDELQSLCHEQKQEIESLTGDYSGMKSKCAELEQERNRYAEQTSFAELQLEQEREARHSESMKENEIRIMMHADNLKALDYVANRESERRNQPWSRSHVINHFIFSRFIKGELNGDLRSIPDNVLERLFAKEQPKPTQKPPIEEEEGREEELSL